VGFPERIDRGCVSRYDRFSYLCCQGNCLRAARRGVAERRRPHGLADASSTNKRAAWRSCEERGGLRRVMRKEPANRRAQAAWSDLVGSVLQEREAVRGEFRQHQGKRCEEPAATPRWRHRARCGHHTKGGPHTIRGSRSGRAHGLPYQSEAVTGRCRATNRAASEAVLRQPADGVDHDGRHPRVHRFASKGDDRPRKALTFTARDGTPRHVPE
jgi:hypothetical protein